MPVSHYENFPVASALLPARLRKPVDLIYRFARAADDFADEGDLPGHERLALLASFGDELRMVERGAPASSEQGSRLRDANVSESGAAPSSAGVASVSGVTSPKGARRRAEEGPLRGSDPEGAHRADVDARMAGSTVAFPQAGPLLHVTPAPVPPSDRAPSRHPLFQELAPIIKEYRLPFELFHDLLSAFAQDVTKTRYADYAEVLDYCRRSANPVGRLLLALYGAATPQNLRWSDHICSSLQIINFLQDIAIDDAKGRVYMPQDELARFRVSEAQIAARDASGAWRDFMTFQVNRTRRMLWDGAPLGRSLTGRVGLEMRMIIAGGDRILTKILNANADVFRHRPVLRAYDWPLMFARTFSIR
ncbi:MAG: squalene/phytoene synthase family protein [Betaproteobacteria bacterium]|nr:squalene/phytoene synthase family protein [Betaproteobacteria bacterium]